MTEFPILSAMAFSHGVTIHKVLGKKHCHDKGSLLSASAGSVGSGLFGHLLPGGSAVAASPFAPGRLLAISTALLGQHEHGVLGLG